MEEHVKKVIDDFTRVMLLACRAAQLTDDARLQSRIYEAVMLTRKLIGALQSTISRSLDKYDQENATLEDFSNNARNN